METLYTFFLSHALALFVGGGVLMVLLLFGLFMLLARCLARLSPAPLPPSAEHSIHSIDIHPTTGQQMAVPGFDVSGNPL